MFNIITTDWSRKDSVEHMFKMSVLFNEHLRENYRCSMSLKDFFEEVHRGGKKTPLKYKFDIRRIYLDSIKGFDQDGEPQEDFLVYSLVDKKKDIVKHASWVSEEDIPYANFLWDTMSRRRNLVKAMNLYKK